MVYSYSSSLNVEPISSGFRLRLKPFSFQSLPLLLGRAWMNAQSSISRSQLNGEDNRGQSQHPVSGSGDPQHPRRSEDQRNLGDHSATSCRIPKMGIIGPAWQRNRSGPLDSQPADNCACLRAGRGFSCLGTEVEAGSSLLRYRCSCFDGREFAEFIVPGISDGYCAEKLPDGIWPNSQAHSVTYKGSMPISAVVFECPLSGLS